MNKKTNRTSARKAPKKLDDLLRDLKEDELKEVHGGVLLDLGGLALRDRQDTTH